MAQRKAKFLVEAEDATGAAMQSVQRNLGRVNGAAEAVAGTFQRVFLASLAVTFGKAFVTAADEAEQASARLGAVVRATGMAAGFAKEELDEMADSMAEATQFDDESIRNAQSVLLKFGVIQEQVFTRALKLSADYAAFMGSELPEAAQTLGKALASPAEGLGALERQIGKIAPATKQMIEDLVQTGKVAEAQGVILDLLKGKIGGTAEEMNTGYTQSTRIAKKAWDELLESIGRTGAVQAPVNFLFKNVAGTFRDIKEIIDNGDWTEKVLAIGKLMTGQTGFKLTQFGPGPDAAARAAADAAAKANPPNLIDFDKEQAKQDKAHREQIARAKEAAAEKKRLGDESTRESERQAQREVDEEQELARITAEAWSYHYAQQAKEEKELAEGREEMMKQWFKTIDDADEQAIEDGQILLDSLNAKTNKTSDAARQLGLTFSSAFEDAIVGGKGLRGVLGGIAMDVAKIGVRKSLTEPLAAGVSGLFDGIDFGGLFDFGGAELLSGARASGGDVLAGGSYLVGERGPERFTPDSNGSITPNHAMGGVTIHQSFSFGSDVDRATLRAWGESVKQQTIAAVADGRMRGGSYAGAFRG